MSIDSAPGKPPSILVVDDDKSMRMLLRLALEQEGYQVVEAKDGEACLAAYKQYHPQLVLLDAVMPGIDGFTCCNQLQALSNRNSSGQQTVQGHTPILMITVLDDPDSVDRAFEAGATDYITKPIHWAVLRHRVRRLIEQHAQSDYIEALRQQLEAANHEIQVLKHSSVTDEATREG